jgi:hypothetical protein
MKCPACSIRIDEDSKFCDQCGAEIFRCPVCATPGRGPVCVKDGTPLGRFAVADSGHRARANMNMLLLTNATLGLRLEVRPGDILGRKEGRLANELKNQLSISGRHAQLDCNAMGDWTIVDLGSRNGSMVDGARLEAGVSVPIQAGSRLLLANVEFLVGVA